MQERYAKKDGLTGPGVRMCIAVTQWVCVRVCGGDITERMGEAGPTQGCTDP